MREYARKSESQPRTLDSKPDVSRQASIDVILQQYKDCNVQRYTGDEELIQGEFDTVQREEKPNNTGLPDSLKTGIENLSGYSMDDVEVHYDSDKPAQLNALAYAQGTDIHIAPGQEKHLPHEAWHVVQQKQGRVQPVRQIQGIDVNDNVGLEKEADVMGEKSIQRKNVPGMSYFNNSKSSNIIQCKWISDVKSDCEYWDQLVEGERWYRFKEDGNGPWIYYRKMINGELYGVDMTDEAWADYLSFNENTPSIGIEIEMRENTNFRLRHDDFKDHEKVKGQDVMIPAKASEPDGRKIVDENLVKGTQNSLCKIALGTIDVTLDTQGSYGGATGDSDESLVIELVFDHRYFNISILKSGYVNTPIGLIPIEFFLEIMLSDLQNLTYRHLLIGANDIQRVIIENASKADRIKKEDEKFDTNLDDLSKDSEVERLKEELSSKLKALSSDPKETLFSKIKKQLELDKEYKPKISEREKLKESEISEGRKQLESARMAEILKIREDDKTLDNKVFPVTLGRGSAMHLTAPVSVKELKPLMDFTRNETEGGNTFDIANLEKMPEPSQGTDSQEKIWGDNVKTVYELISRVLKSFGSCIPDPKQRLPIMPRTSIIKTFSMLDSIDEKNVILTQLKSDFKSMSDTPISSAITSVNIGQILKALEAVIAGQYDEKNDPFCRKDVLDENLAISAMGGKGAIDKQNNFLSVYEFRSLLGETPMTIEGLKNLLNLKILKRVYDFDVEVKLQTSSPEIQKKQILYIPLGFTEGANSAENNNCLLYALGIENSYMEIIRTNVMYYEHTMGFDGTLDYQATTIDGFLTPETVFPILKKLRLSLTDVWIYNQRTGVWTRWDSHGEPHYHERDVTTANPGSKFIAYNGINHYFQLNKQIEM